MVLLIKVLQVILALSTLIIFHELGHFFWARLFGIRVEKFFLFFDVGGKALARWKWGETQFGIGWLPFGGYCKIAGMIDESMDLKQLESEPEPWEFRSKPAWQRLLVMAGGVLNNLLLAVIIYCVIAGVWGEAFVSNRDARIIASPLAEEMGFRTGDHIIDFDGYEPDNFGMLQADLVRRNPSFATVKRGGDTLQLYIDKAFIPEVLDYPGLFDLAVPFVVDSVMAGSGNAGCLARGDSITALGGVPVSFLQDAREVLALNRESEIPAVLVRGADTLTTPVKVDSLGHIGVFMKTPGIERRSYGFFGSIPAGLRLTVRSLSDYIRDLGLLARPSTGAYKSVGSFIAIGQVFPSVWDWYSFLSILALLSVMLAVMNLIPIPALDGGHILFLLYEIFSGRKPSDRFLALMQMIGMILLLGLMMLAFGNDISRLFK